MPRENLNDLMAFITVARELSFTRAATMLGVSQSALSHSIKSLENRLGLRLLTRTTRSISTTEAGERLMTSLGPMLDEIKSELNAVLDMRERPAGLVRITATDYAIRFIIWPKLEPLLHQYPSIKVELITDYTMIDIAAERFDAGVRLGELVSPGMISLKISDKVKFVVVASPGYFSKMGIPLHPRDLTSHRCINLRVSAHYGVFTWEFHNEGDIMRIKVDGQVLFNNAYNVITAALSGLGLAYVPEGLVADYIKSGELVSVLYDWCPEWSGYHIFYPSRIAPSKAFRMVVDALRINREC